MDEYFSVVQRLPTLLARPLGGLPPWQAAAIQEIRLRMGCSVMFTVNGSVQSAAQYCSALIELDQIILTQDLLWETLVELSGRSLHSHEEELCQGYLTMPGGHRVGVGGNYAKSGIGYVLKAVQSLNLRIARTHSVLLPAQLSELLRRPFGGLAVIGPPLSGKTTVLRSMAIQLGHSGRSCVVIDERDELFAQRNDSFSLGAADVISGVEKAQGAQMALRTLSPQVILLDELGDLSEVAVLRQAMFSGVDFIVTLHAASLEEAEQKPQFRTLLQARLLRAACVLAGRSQPGVIAEVRCW